MVATAVGSGAAKMSKPALQQWVDIWLLASEYSLSWADNSRDSVFPMLQNKVWDEAAGLRVFLLVGAAWNEQSQAAFDAMVRELRLGVDRW